MNITSELLLAYLDEQLSAEERREVEAALQRDPKLRQELNTLRQLRGLLRATLGAVEQIPVHPRAIQAGRRRNFSRAFLAITVVGVFMLGMILTWRSIKPVQQASATSVPANQPTETIGEQITKRELAPSAKGRIVTVSDSSDQPNQQRIQTYGEGNFSTNPVVQIAATERTIYRLEQNNRDVVLIQSDMQGNEAWRTSIQASPENVHIVSNDQAGLSVIVAEPTTIRWQLYDQTGTLKHSNATTTNTCNDKSIHVATTNTVTSVVCNDKREKNCLFEIPGQTSMMMPCDYNVVSNVYQFQHDTNQVRRVSTSTQYLISDDTLFRIGWSEFGTNDQLLGANVFQLATSDLKVAPEYLAIAPNQQTLVTAYTSLTSTTFMTYQPQTNGMFRLVNKVQYDYGIAPYSMQFNRDGTYLYALAATKQADGYNTVLELDPLWQIPHAEYSIVNQRFRRLVVV